MTEFFIVMASAIAAFLLLDPFYYGALTISGFAKTTVLVICMGSLAFHLFGRWVIAPARLHAAIKEVVTDWWPLLILSVFIMVGSAYARFVDDIGQTFLGMGVGMLFLPLMAIAVRASDVPLVFIKGLAAVYFLMVLAMFGLMIGTDHVFHESIYLAVSLGAYFLCASQARFWQLGLGVLLLAAAALSFKNTTFLMLLTTIAGCLLIAAVRVARKRDRLTTIVLLYFGILLVFLCAGVLLYAWLNYRTKLPSGNVEYRVEMYGIAWRRFLDSPVWGNGFTLRAVNYFSLYHVAQGTQDLPTHSDILDILANGGVVGLLLWLGFVWRIAVIGWDVVRKLTNASDEVDMRAWRWLFVLLLMQVNAIITYAVNPPLVNAVAGFWIWGSAGLMWALHRLMTRPIQRMQKLPVQMGHAAWA